MRTLTTTTLGKRLASPDSPVARTFLPTTTTRDTIITLIQPITTTIHINMD